MVSNENKKILIRKLKEYGRMSSNQFFEHVKPMAKQTFHNTINELIENKQIEREEIRKKNDKRLWVYYSLPEIREFEEEEVKVIVEKYFRLLELTDKILQDKFILPKIGKKNKNFSKRGEFIVKSKKQIEVLKREYVIDVIAEMLATAGTLQILTHSIPKLGESNIIENVEHFILQLHRNIEQIIKKYEILQSEIYLAIQFTVESKMEDMAIYVDSEAEKNWHLKLDYDADNFFVTYRDKQLYDRALASLRKSSKQKSKKKG